MDIWFPGPLVGKVLRKFSWTSVRIRTLSVMLEGSRASCFKFDSGSYALPRFGSPVGTLTFIGPLTVAVIRTPVLA